MSVAEAKHTPEPWSLLGAAIHTQGVLVKLKHRANAARIVACVNEFQGVPDPAKAMADYRRRAQDLRELTREHVAALAEIAALREVAEAAKALRRYQDDGAPDYSAWDGYVDALFAALAKLEGLS